MSDDFQFHDEMHGRIPLRFCFVFLRTCIVGIGKKPSSWPFCHYVAWQRMPDQPNRARVYYVRTDLKGDGQRLRLRHRRSLPQEQIVCAKKLSVLPPRRWQHKPTRANRRAAAKLLAKWHTSWEKWSAEFQPVPTWRDHWLSWSRWFGPRKRARQIVLASETGLKSIDNFPFHRASYLKLVWLYPKIPNVIRARDIADHKPYEVVGYFEVDSHKQLGLAQWCQRALVVDHTCGDRKHIYGVDPPESWKDCVVVSTLFQGHEVERATESHLKVCDDRQLLFKRKQDFLRDNNPAD